MLGTVGGRPVFFVEFADDVFGLFHILGISARPSSWWLAAVADVTRSSTTSHPGASNRAEDRPGASPPSRRDLILPPPLTQPMPEACPILLPASARTALPAVSSPSLSAEAAAGTIWARVHAFSTLRGPFRTIFMRGALKGGKSKVLSLSIKCAKRCLARLL
jgi:hypothetical protein